MMQKLKFTKLFNICWNYLVLQSTHFVLIFHVDQGQKLYGEIWYLFQVYSYEGKYPVIPPLMETAGIYREQKGMSLGMYMITSQFANFVINYL